jgi:succinylglutamate desuccinylase
LRPGPRLIVLGAVHGNEVAGPLAIGRALAELDAGRWRIERGSVTFVPVTNPLAHALAQRTGDRNLNRALEPKPQQQDNEDRLANWLCPLLAAHDGLLDLHSFSGGGPPFVMVGPRDNSGLLEPFGQAATEEALVRVLGVQRAVDGWLGTYASGVAQRAQQAQADGLAPGTLPELHPRYGMGTTEYMRSQGGYGVTLECGQHEDPAAPGVAHHAIRQTLALLGIAEGLALAPPQRPFECLRLVEVIDRHDAADRFAKAWTSFDPLAEGELIAVRADGSELRAPQGGYIVFPDVSAQPGHEWFYRAQKSERPL